MLRLEALLEIPLEDYFSGEDKYLIGYLRELLLFTTNVIKMPFDVEESYDTQCPELGPLLKKVTDQSVPASFRAVVSYD